MSLIKIKIEELNTRDLQTRAALNEETVSDYAEAMERGDRFPSVTVFTDGAEYYLADGFHRVEALRRIGKKSVSAELMDGDYKTALLYALKANSTHGLRRTNADKRHALEMAWNARENLFGGEPSNALLADICGVSDRWVRQWRSEQGRNSSYPETSQVATLSQPAPPAAPTMPTRPVRPITAKNSDAQAEQGTFAAPKMPVRRVGRDGKTYTVPVSAPVRPTPPTPPTQTPTHVVDCDRFGTEIPLEINDAFDSELLQSVVRHISAARVILRKAFDEGNIVFGAVRQDVLIHLNNAYNFVAHAHAHCVCRMCQGNGCMACHNRGWQTEEEYDRNPKEFKHGN